MTVAALGNPALAPALIAGFFAGHQAEVAHELARVLEARPDLAREPVSNYEAVFVTFVILHLASVHQAMREGLFATEQAGFFLPDQNHIGKPRCEMETDQGLGTKISRGYWGPVRLSEPFPKLG